MSSSSFLAALDKLVNISNLTRDGISPLVGLFELLFIKDCGSGASLLLFLISAYELEARAFFIVPVFTCIELLAGLFFLD
jgi:hypothetical protein